MCTKKRVKGVWDGMVSRCYSNNRQKLQPTYKGCEISEEFKCFNNFNEWYLMNYFEGCQLDKDLKVVGNKVYSSETCLLIPAGLNKALGNLVVSGKYYPFKNRFRVTLEIDKKQISAKYIYNEEVAKRIGVTLHNYYCKYIATMYPMYSEYILGHIKTGGITNVQEVLEHFPTKGKSFDRLLNLLTLIEVEY